MELNAGELRQYITIKEYQTTTTGDVGNPNRTLVTLFENVPAKILQVQATETEYGRQTTPQYAWSVGIRWLPNINEQCMIEWGNRTLQIETIDEHIETPKRYLTLSCVERRR